PGAYTGFANLLETDHTKTTLVLMNHRVDLAGGWLQVGAYHRRLEDDYDFDRLTEESGVPGAFEHETVVRAAGFQGLFTTGSRHCGVGGQLSAYQLVVITVLSNVDFDPRCYLKLGVIPSVGVLDTGDARVTLPAGLTLDDSNRDCSEV